MTTRIDWHAELDASFGDGRDRPPTDFLGPGRTALRRRRTALGAAALASAIVVGGIGWAVAPGGDGARSGEVASEAPTPTAPTPSEPAASGFQLDQPIASRPEDVRAPGKGDQQYLGQEPVAATGTGGLVIKDGWTIEAIYALEDTPRARTWGVSATPASGGPATWMLIEWERGSSSTTSDPEGKRFALFEDWMDTVWAEQRGVQAPPVSRTVDGQLELSPGVEALETVDHPAEAAAYGPVEEFVAAKLRLPTGTVLFALVGPDGGTTVDPAVLEAPTMAAFLAHLQGQADNGEGLR